MRPTGCALLRGTIAWSARGRGERRYGGSDGRVYPRWRGARGQDPGLLRRQPRPGKLTASVNALIDAIIGRNGTVEEIRHGTETVGYGLQFTVVFYRLRDGRKRRRRDVHLGVGTCLGRRLGINVANLTRPSRTSIWAKRPSPGRYRLRRLRAGGRPAARRRADRVRPLRWGRGGRGRVVGVAQRPVPGVARGRRGSCSQRSEDRSFLASRKRGVSRRGKTPYRRTASKAVRTGLTPRRRGVG